MKKVSPAFVRLGLALVFAMPFASLQAAPAAAPIDESLLGPVTMPPSLDRPLRTPGSRAYACDGLSFYFDGRLIRIAGVPEEGMDSGSDLARQRLQTLLDSGEVQLEGTLNNADGSVMAHVLVNGQNLAMLLGARPALGMAD